MVVVEKTDGFQVFPAAGKKALHPLTPTRHPPRRSVIGHFSSWQNQGMAYWAHRAAKTESNPVPDFPGA
jgi:hypothetical protein